MNMKLGKIGLFIILLLVLLSSALGVTAYETFVTREGNTNNNGNSNSGNSNSGGNRNCHILSEGGIKLLSD